MDLAATSTAFRECYLQIVCETAAPYLWPAQQAHLDEYKGHEHKKCGNTLVRRRGTLTLRSGVSRPAVSWSQPNAHADFLQANANACDHDAPGPVAPAGATSCSSCCTFDNRIGTRPDIGNPHPVCAAAVGATLFPLSSRFSGDHPDSRRSLTQHPSQKNTRAQPDRCTSLQ
jgi:hypothetical protein